MKRVLVTGKSSFIGNAFQEYVARWNDVHEKEEQILIDKISLRTDEWKQMDFSEYDAVLHLAGIAHVDIGKKAQQDIELAERYHRVNCELTLQVADKAKTEGVKQFIFMSSIIVFGDSAPISRTKMITAETKPEPKGFYGQSKLDAESGLQERESEEFRVCIVRPPMVYGEGCKGNYPKLKKIAGISPIFPKVYNQRSVISVEHLCHEIASCICEGRRGILHPQDAEYRCVSEWVKEMAQEQGHVIWLVPGFAWLFRLLERPLPIIDKIFGNLTYARQEKETV